MTGPNRPLTATTITAMLATLEPAGKRPRRLLRAAAHLALPTGAGAHQIVVTSDKLTWRGQHTGRSGDDLADICQVVAAGWHSSDRALAHTARPSTWLKPLQRGRRWHLAGVRELFGGPTVIVDVDTTGDPITSGMLAHAADTVIAALETGAAPPGYHDGWLIDGDRRQWRLHRAGA